LKSAVCAASGGNRDEKQRGDPRSPHHVFLPMLHSGTPAGHTGIENQSKSEHNRSIVAKRER